MNRVLLIDDDEQLGPPLAMYFKRFDLVLEQAFTPSKGLARLQEGNFDAAILDIMLPEMDGLEVLQQIRRESDVYVMMLTAKSEEFDRVMGLTVGADDYLTKPFSPRELVARVKAILRRGRNAGQEERQVFSFEHLKIDTQRYEVYRDGEMIDLTVLEFKLLATLAEYAGMVLSREQLLERVWGYDYYGEARVVDVHIGHIRQKLEHDPADPQFVQTVRGVGYKFADKPR